MEDEFYSKKNSKMFEKISKRYGIEVSELDLEYRKRVELLYQLFQRRIYDFNEVQKIVNEYYKKPENVLKRFNIH
jgi:hypothetical protein